MNPTTADYQAPEQSPHWDDELPLAQMLAEAKFFILRKGMPHGDLVDVVLQVVSPSKPGQDTRYEIRALNHDAAGVTCVASGTLTGPSIEEDEAAGRAQLTLDPAQVLRYIWEVMNCHPNADAKLFTKL